MKEDRFLKMSSCVIQVTTSGNSAWCFFPYYGKWKHDNAITKNIMK
jgi:hypothetical protein